MTGLKLFKRLKHDINYKKINRSKDTKRVDNITSNVNQFACTFEIINSISHRQHTFARMPHTLIDLLTRHVCFRQPLKNAPTIAQNDKKYPHMRPTIVRIELNFIP